jgi:hypothetical protein
MTVRRNPKVTPVVYGSESEKSIAPFNEKFCIIAVFVMASVNSPVRIHRNEVAMISLKLNDVSS